MNEINPIVTQSSTDIYEEMLRLIDGAHAITDVASQAEFEDHGAAYGSYSNLFILLTDMLWKIRSLAQELEDKFYQRV